MDAVPPQPFPHLAILEMLRAELEPMEKSAKTLLHRESMQELAPPTNSTIGTPPRKG